MTLSPNQYLEQDCGYTTPCWVWQRALDYGGYGHMRINKRYRGAHRVYWERENGPIPDGLQLDHLCRNRPCVRPSHLEPVTHAENMRRGAGTTLTTAQVREIKELLGTGNITGQVIAARYGVCDQTVYDIANGRCWQNVEN